MNVTTSHEKRAFVKLRSYVPAFERSPGEGERVRAVQLERPERRSQLSALLPPLAFGAIILVCWYASTTYGHVQSFMLPTPAAVFSSFIDGVQAGILPSNTLLTIQESLLGFLLAVALALPLGYGVAKSWLVAQTLQPYLAAGQAVPAIVLAPFLYIWFGPGVLAVVIVCMLCVFFPMVMNTVLGIQTIDRTLLEAARLEGASGWSLLQHIEFPLSLPAILAAVRTSLTLSITGAIVGEFICTPDRGLGGLVFIAISQLNMAFMFATVIVMAVLAALYYSATLLLTKAVNMLY